MNDDLFPLVTVEEAKQCAMLMASTQPWITLNRNYEQCIKLFLDRSFNTYILKENDNIIALSVVQTNCFPQPYIRALVVDEAFPGKGIGTMMITKMEEKYTHINGNMFIAVSSFNNRARALYESLGYVKMCEFNDYIVEGHSEILLQKNIAVISKEPPPVYVSADLKDMDTDFIYDNLKTLYWATNITRENLIGRMLNSICFGVFADGKQKGFARVITDYFSFAYLADVFIEEQSRGKGLSRVLLEYIINYPVLKDQKWLLATRDMHSLYEKFGFIPVIHPQRFMGKNGWRSF
jgi:GNAT superfamily N-acetyltransferase